MGSQWTSHSGHDLSPDEVLHLLERNIRDYAIFVLDPDGWVLTWNAGAERIKGYRAEEIIGRHFSTFYPESDVATGKPERLLTIARRDGRAEDEGWRVRKDGTRFWAHVVITALYDDSGELRGFGKVTSDATKRHEADRALRESEERFRLLVQDTTDYAIFMLDPTGHVASWNAGAERIKGYYSDEIIGKHFSVFYPHQDLAAGRPAQNLQTALLAGRVEDEGWRVRKDGTRFWANIVITALYDEHHRLRGFGKVTRDVTERRESERSLRDWARQLQAQQTEQRRIGLALRDSTAQELNSIVLLQEVLSEQLPGPEAAQLRSLTERLSHSVEELSAFADRLCPQEGDSQPRPASVAEPLKVTIND